MLAQFDRKTDRRLLLRRIGVAANDTDTEGRYVQLDLFTDYDMLDRERQIRKAMLEVRRKYGSNAVVKGTNLLDGATGIERNEQIGGHRA